MIDNLDIISLTDIADKLDSVAIATEEAEERVRIANAAKMLHCAICLLTGEGL